jgi:hypothetical protein
MPRKPKSPQPPQPPLLLSPFEGPGWHAVLASAPPLPPRIVPTSYVELQALESSETAAQHRWERELATLVRDGKLSIECALSVAALYAGSLARHQWIRATARYHS